MPYAGVSGKIKHLRVTDSAIHRPYGSGGDTLDTQVIVVLNNSDKFFGFDIKPGPDLPSHLAMLGTLREAYVHDLTVGFWCQFAAGKKASKIINIDLER